MLYLRIFTQKKNQDEIRFDARCLRIVLLGNIPDMMGFFFVEKVRIVENNMFFFLSFF